MKQIGVTPGLIALLNSGDPFEMADMFTLTLVSGQVLRMTSYDEDLPLDGNTYTHTTIQRGLTRTSRGVSVDELEVIISPDSRLTYGGQPLLRAIRNGALDGAILKLQRVFMPTKGDTSLGSVIMFLGRIAPAEWDRATAVLTVKSILELMNIKMPRNVYQKNCLHTLFDAGCTKVKADYLVAGNVATGSTRNQINCNLSAATAYFDLGTITFLTGLNAGATRAIKSYVPGIVTITLPLPSLPTAGDTFQAAPGCNRIQLGDCTAKFNNVINFRGYPYIPAPETAY